MAKSEKELVKWVGRKLREIYYGEKAYGPALPKSKKKKKEKKEVIPKIRSESIRIPRTTATMEDLREAGMSEKEIRKFLDLGAQ
ncbi:MAG TPA: hypothetical protein VMW50_08165 [Dehalococcoidia bacterium]|nr:hypothetical protein [Dehalococcoidia bacterium]